MADNERIELSKLYVAGESRYSYFLLAAAASAIAFAVQKTSGLRLSWYEIPLAFAVVCWGISFYFGCRCVNLMQGAMFMNISMLELSSVRSGNPEELKGRIKLVLSEMNGMNDKATAYDRWQFRLLITGAILFLAWHVLGMYRLTIIGS